MDANRCLKANYLHPFLAKNSQFLPKSANFCRWPNWTNFGDSRAKSRQISPISKKNCNVSANRDCLVHETRDSHQNLRIRATRGLLLPFLIWAVHQFASDGLVFLQKIWTFTTQAILQANISRPQTFMILWNNFQLQTCFSQTCKSCLSRH